MPLEHPHQVRLRIVASALRALDGTVVCGVRHFDKFMMPHIIPEMPRVEFNWNKPEQGFVDNKMNFLTRREAWDIALAAGQIDHVKDKANQPLTSEDLW